MAIDNVLKESEMITFEVRDMTCGHCVSSISKAVQFVDRGARLQFDLAAQRVQIEPTETDMQQLREVITEAGYTPVPVQDAAAPGAPPAQRGGCCCSGASGCHS